MQVSEALLRGACSFFGLYPVVLPIFDELSYISCTTLWVEGILKSPSHGSTNLLLLSFKNIQNAREFEKRFYSAGKYRIRAIVAPLLQTLVPFVPEFLYRSRLNLQQISSTGKSEGVITGLSHGSTVLVKTPKTRFNFATWTKSTLLYVAGCLVSLPFHICYIRQLFRMVTAQDTVSAKQTDYYFWSCFPKSIGEVGSCVIPYTAWGFVEISLRQLFNTDKNRLWQVYRRVLKRYNLEEEDVKTSSSRRNRILASLVHSSFTFAENFIYNVAYATLTTPFKLIIARLILLEEGGNEGKSLLGNRGGIIGVVETVFQQEGITGFWKGYFYTLLYRLINGFIWDFVATFALDLYYGVPKVDFDVTL
eukprot:TRINITY_DN1956_c0_g3_i1.p1 TRINITY_DN1956_c0_g3~~TRINITY_DN1956_c0_g3_i1.p1  ORF type:complete len:364 (+),score=50.92 TRINITY_DN1956_c0_g3_i1:27-1118(+)